MSFAWYARRLLTFVAVSTPIPAAGADLLDPEPAAVLIGYEERREFGFALAGGDFDGDGFADLLVGAPGEVDRAGDGFAYHFPGGPDSIETTPAWSIQGDYEQLGLSVAAADFDLDGYSDAVVGGYNTESVYLSGGSGTGLATPWVIASPGDSGAFGRQLDARGDVNGDGYPDLLVGSGPDRCYPYFACPGFAFAYLGSPTGLAAEPWSSIPYGGGGELWHRLVFAGDTDGDGYDDVAIALSYKGVYVHPGGSAGLTLEPEVTIKALSADDFGRLLSAAGDMNGDGYADVAVGSPGYDTGAASFGRVDVFLGSAASTEGEPGVTLADARYSVDYWQASLGPAGDLDRDGFDDLLVGSASAGDDGEGEIEGLGGVYVYRGGTAVAETEPATGVFGLNYGDFLGDAVTQIGDTNGDGEPDVAVAGAGYDNYIGQVWVFNGTGDVTERDADSDGFEAADDCDDADPAVNADATEVCNGIDDDCDRRVDIDARDGTAQCSDADGDGATVGDPVVVCPPAKGWAPCNPEDCADADASIHPGAEEVAGDGIDQDCDGDDAPVPGDTSDTDAAKDRDPSCGCSTRRSAGRMALAGAALLLVAGRRR